MDAKMDLLTVNAQEKDDLITGSTTDKISIARSLSDATDASNEIGSNNIKTQYSHTTESMIPGWKENEKCYDGMKATVSRDDYSSAKVSQQFQANVTMSELQEIEMSDSGQHVNNYNRQVLYSTPAHDLGSNIRSVKCKPDLLNINFSEHISPSSVWQRNERYCPDSNRKDEVNSDAWKATIGRINRDKLFVLPIPQQRKIFSINCDPNTACYLERNPNEEILVLSETKLRDINDITDDINGIDHNGQIKDYFDELHECTPMCNNKCLSNLKPGEVVFYHGFKSHGRLHGLMAVKCKAKGLTALTFSEETADMEYSNNLRKLHQRQWNMEEFSRVDELDKKETALNENEIISKSVASEHYNGQEESIIQRITAGFEAFDKFNSLWLTSTPSFPNHLPNCNIFSGQNGIKSDKQQISNINLRPSSSLEFQPNIEKQSSQFLLHQELKSQIDCGSSSNAENLGSSEEDTTQDKIWKKTKFSQELENFYFQNATEIIKENGRDIFRVKRSRLSSECEGNVLDCLASYSLNMPENEDERRCDDFHDADSKRKCSKQKRKRSDLRSKIPLKLELLLDMPPVPHEVQLDHTWNPDDGSFNMFVQEDNKFVCSRRPVELSTDCIRCKVGYDKGIHLFDLNWPMAHRGTHAVIGVSTIDAPVHHEGYLSLVGNNQHSWGWDLMRKKAYHDAENKSGVDYPVREKQIDFVIKDTVHGPELTVPESFQMVLNMEEGVLGFMLNGNYLGHAHCGLKGRRLFPMVSAVWGNCEISLKYIAGIDHGPPTLVDLCRHYLRQHVSKHQIPKGKFDDLELPTNLRRYLVFK